MSGIVEWPLPDTPPTPPRPKPVATADLVAEARALLADDPIPHGPGWAAFERIAWTACLTALAKALEDTAAERDRLQAAVDRAHGVLTSSAYVGGPSAREAWITALDALGSVVTRHQGQENP